MWLTEAKPHGCGAQSSHLIHGRYRFTPTRLIGRPRLLPQFWSLSFATARATRKPFHLQTQPANRASFNAPFQVVSHCSVCFLHPTALLPSLRATSLPHQTLQNTATMGESRYGFDQLPRAARTPTACARALSRHRGEADVWCLLTGKNSLHG